MDALETAGRLPGSAYKGATMYTTLSPCQMCTGACLMYGIKRVVLGENKTFMGGEDWLRHEGAEVINLENDECFDLMQKFIAEVSISFLSARSVSSFLWALSNFFLLFSVLTTGTKILASN